MIKLISIPLVLVLLLGCVSNKTYKAQQANLEELQRINDDLMVLLAYMNRDIERINEELRSVDLSFQEFDTEVLQLKERLNWIYENYAFTSRIEDLETYSDEIAGSLDLVRDDLLALGYVPDRLQDIDDEFGELRDELQLIEETIEDFLEQNRIVVANLVTKVELARELHRLETSEKVAEQVPDTVTDLHHETGEIKEQVQSLTADMAQVKRQIITLNQEVQDLIKSLEKTTPEARIQINMNDRPIEPITRVYSNAKSAYDRRTYEQAIRMFEDFIAQNPDDPLAANSQYWMAESYYAAGNYRKAMREFESVIQRYPSSPKAADAQVKIGLCYIKLNDLDMARAELRKVKNLYPNYERQALVDSLLSRIGN
ncbi:MAG: tol-pal system protein YbgF [Candidatus Cloacimonetes bacterium]|nr:tol-pal system protein YbgF [Candidatus Cloacimonadota bacterium]